MSTIKSTAKKAALFTIDYVAAPLHIGVQLSSNLLQVAADGIAKGEGYLTEKIDNTKERDEVATNRVANTQMRFEQTAQALDLMRAKLQAGVNKADDKIDEIKARYFKKDKPIQAYVVDGQGSWNIKSK